MRAKSSVVRSLIGRPRPSVTYTSMRTSSTVVRSLRPEVDWAGAGKPWGTTVPASSMAIGTRSHGRACAKGVLRAPHYASTGPRSAWISRRSNIGRLRAPSRALSRGAALSMSYPVFIAGRYLLAQRKQAIIYVISLISVLGVIVGVAALVVVLALMTGFQDQIQDKIFGANAHLTIFSGLGGRPLEDVPAVLARLKECEPVRAAAPVVYEKGMATGELNAAGAAVLIKGIDPETERDITDLASQVRGDLRVLSLPGARGRDRAILGKDLALNLGVGPGDVVRVIIAQANVTPFLTVPKSREFEVAGIADAGFYDYDSSRVYVALSAARRFAGLLPSQASAIEVRVRDPRRLQEAATAVQGALGSGF